MYWIYDISHWAGALLFAVVFVGFTCLGTVLIRPWVRRNAADQNGWNTSIVLDGNGDPMCIVETTEVEVRPYDEVGARFACEEGEGDRSLEYWRKAHWRFFSRTLASIGKEPAADMPLVCERFRVVYK